MPGGRCSGPIGAPEVWRSRNPPTGGDRSSAGRAGTATAATRDAARRRATIRGVVFSAARQTFVTRRRQGVSRCVPAIMWSDRRAGRRSRRPRRAGAGGTEAVRRLTGTILDAASPAAKLAWLDSHEPGATEAGALDALAARFRRAQDDRRGRRPTRRSRSRAVSTTRRSSPSQSSPGRSVDMLPPVHCVRRCRRHASAPMRPASSGSPQAFRSSWAPATGHARFSGPARASSARWCRGEPRPTCRCRCATGPTCPASGSSSRGVRCGGFLIEAGLSSAGSFLDWLASIAASRRRRSPRRCPRSWSGLLDSPPGANGVTAVSWLGGARAPWWRDDARAAFVGLSPEHTIGDMARAAIEAVAFEVRPLPRVRSGDAVGTRPSLVAHGRRVTHGALARGPRCGRPGSRRAAGVRGLPLRPAPHSSRSRAAGVELALDTMDPAEHEVVPDPVLVELYDAHSPDGRAGGRSRTRARRPFGRCI